MNEIKQEQEAVLGIFEAIRQRKQRGIEALYAAYGGALYQQILQLVPVAEEAQEILQDVFLKVWEKIDSYDPSAGRPYTWMARIARNRAIDHLRSAGKRREAKTDSLTPIVSNDNRLAEVFHTDHIGLAKVVSALDTDHRLIIEYLYFKDYSQSEAAEALNIPLGTIKTRSRRALQQLRTMLGTELLTFCLAYLLASLYCLAVVQNIVHV